MRRPRRSAAAAAALAAGLFAACSNGEEAAGGDAAVARGRTLYGNVCIACHNADPTRDGSLGPAIAGSPRELLEAKVLRGEYPPGYAPKRPGAVMPRYEYVAEGIPDLAAFLAQVRE